MNFYFGRYYFSWRGHGRGRDRGRVGHGVGRGRRGGPSLSTRLHTPLYATARVSKFAGDFVFLNKNLAKPHNNWPHSAGVPSGVHWESLSESLSSIAVWHTHGTDMGTESWAGTLKYKARRLLHAREEFRLLIISFKERCVECQLPGSSAGPTLVPGSTLRCCSRRSPRNRIGNSEMGSVRSGRQQPLRQSVSRSLKLRV